MRVLVWQQYGTPKVLAAETPLHFMKIFEELKVVVSGWGLDDSLSDLFEAMGKARSRQICERHFYGFVGPHKYTHESFEQFEFADVENV